MPNPPGRPVSVGRTNWVPGNSPPVKLRPKHHLLAYLIAAGRRDSECAEILGYSPQRITQIKHSPLFQHEVKSAMAELRERSMTDFAEWLTQETPRTLKRAAELRDQDDSLPTAASVTLALLDRISPKVTKHEEERNIRITLDRRDTRAMAMALAEDSGRSTAAIDAEFTTVEELAGTVGADADLGDDGDDPADDRYVKTLDEVLNEMGDRDEDVRWK